MEDTFIVSEPFIRIYNRVKTYAIGSNVHLTRYLKGGNTEITTFSVNRIYTNPVGGAVSNPAWSAYYVGTHEKNRLS